MLSAGIPGLTDRPHSYIKPRIFPGNIGLLITVIAARFLLRHLESRVRQFDLIADGIRAPCRPDVDVLSYKRFADFPVFGSCWYRITLQD